MPATAVRRRPARALPLLPRLQPGLRPRAPGLVGGAQGDRPGRHRRPVPPGLGGGDPHQAGPGRARAVPAAARPGAGRAGHAAGVGAGAGAVPAVGGDLHDLQAGREDPQGAPPALRARPRRRGRADPAAGPDRQPRLGRPADPRARLPRPAGDAAGLGRGRLPGAGARLDALVRRARLEVRVRLGRRLLRRPGRAHLRDRDRAVVRPGDEPPGLLAGPLPAGLELRRALAAGAGPGGDGAVLRALVRRGARGAGDRGRAGRDDRVLPGGGQVPPRRAPDLRGAAGAGRDPGPGRALPGLRQAGHRRRAAPGRGAGRPARSATCRPARRAGAAWCSCRRWSASCSASAPKSKSVEVEVGRLVDRFGPELSILQDVPLDEVAAVGPPGIDEALRRLRSGQVVLAGGYDGEYGVVRLFEPKELADLRPGTPRRSSTSPPRAPPPTSGGGDTGGPARSDCVCAPCGGAETEPAGTGGSRWRR